MKVKIFLEEETCRRLEPLKDRGESFDTVINRILDYIEFHPEYWNRES